MTWLFETPWARAAKNCSRRRFRPEHASALPCQRGTSAANDAVGKNDRGSRACIRKWQAEENPAGLRSWTAGGDCPHKKRPAPDSALAIGSNTGSSETFYFPLWSSLGAGFGGALSCFGAGAGRGAG